MNGKKTSRINDRLTRKWMTDESGVAEEGRRMRVMRSIRQGKGGRKKRSRRVTEAEKRDVKCQARLMIAFLWSVRFFLSFILLPSSARIQGFSLFLPLGLSLCHCQFGGENLKAVKGLDWAEASLVGLRPRYAPALGRTASK